MRFKINFLKKERKLETLDESERIIRDGLAKVKSDLSDLEGAINKELERREEIKRALEALQQNVR